MFAFGADMVMLNTMDLDNMENNKDLKLSYQTLRQRCKKATGDLFRLSQRDLKTVVKKLYIAVKECFVHLNMFKNVLT